MHCAGPNTSLAQKPPYCPRSVHAPSSAPNVLCTQAGSSGSLMTVACWLQGESKLDVLLSLSLPSALCSAHPGATASSGLGCSWEEHSLQSKDWHTRMAGQSTFPGKERGRAGGFWLWAGCSPCLWRNKCHDEPGEMWHRTGTWAGHKNVPWSGARKTLGRLFRNVMRRGTCRTRFLGSNFLLWHLK